MREVARLLRGRPDGAPPLVPRGLGTRGAPATDGIDPAHRFEILDLSHLSGIESLDRDEMVFTALAGTPIDAIAAAADEVGLVLCPLVPIGSGGTLGGLLASGFDSPAWPTEGRVRDAVLGIEGVTGDGAPLRSGGRVVKNVTGYDLVRLFSGSRGTLGVIVRVHGRLRPRPDRWVEVTATRPASELADLLGAARRAPDAIAVRLEASGGTVTLRALVEEFTASGGGAASRVRAIGEAIGATEAPVEVPPDALAAWLSPGPGTHEVRTARGWIERLGALSGGTHDAEGSCAVVFPFAGPGVVSVPAAAEGPSTARPPDRIEAALRRAWDPRGRLADATALSTGGTAPAR